MKEIREIINPEHFSWHDMHRITVSKTENKYGLKKDNNWAVRPIFSRVEYLDGFEHVLLLSGVKYYLLILFYDTETYFAVSDFEDLKFFKIKDNLYDSLSLADIGDIYEELEAHFSHYLFSLKKGNYYGYFDFEHKETIKPTLISVNKHEIIKIPETGYKNFIFETVIIDSISYKCYMNNENKIIVE